MATAIHYRDAYTLRLCSTIEHSVMLTIIVVATLPHCCQSGAPSIIHPDAPFGSTLHIHTTQSLLTLLSNGTQRIILILFFVPFCLCVTQ